MHNFNDGNKIQDVRFAGNDRKQAVRFCRMLPVDNINHPSMSFVRIVSTLMIVCLLAVSGRADEKTVAPQVDWAVAKLAYQRVEAWVAKESVERNPNDKPLHVTGVVGAKVTLRYGGLTVGAGHALVDGFDPEKRIDLNELAAKATGIALVNFKDQKPGGGKWILDADLQIAHSPHTIELQSDASSKAIFFEFAAGFHGLRMTHHRLKDTTAIIWPASALAANMRPDSHISGLLAELNYKFNEVQAVQPKIGHDGGPQLQRFEVIHLVRLPNGKEPQRLTRGGAVKSASDVSMASVKSMADQLFGHIEKRIAPKGTMPGTYLPTSDRYKPLKADIEDIAITLAALVERTRYLYNVNPNGLDYHRAKEQVRVLVTHLRSKLVGDNAESESPEAMAHLMTAIMDSPHLGALRLDRNWLGKKLVKLQDKKGRFIDPVSRKPVKTHTQAIVTAALVKLFEQTRDQSLPAVIRLAQDHLWANANNTVEVVSAQPWMADALFDMNRLLPPLEEAGKAKFAKRVEAIKTLVESLRKKKLVRGTPRLGPADVVGGVDLINDTNAGAPTPDWRTAHVLALLARHLGNEAIVPEKDRIMAQFDCTLLVRFLGQLMFDEANCYYVRSRTDVMHGVRFAPWDNRLHAEPTAMTLLSLTRLQVALDPKLAKLGD